MSSRTTPIRRATRAFVLGLAAASLGCPAASTSNREPTNASKNPKAQPHAEELNKLRQFEDRSRQRTDFGQSDPVPELGSDPFDVVALASKDGAPPRHVGVLRGSDAIVLLDAQGSESSRAAAPRSPSGIALAPDGSIWVSGEYADHLAHYVLGPDGLGDPESMPLGTVRGVRDIAVGPSGVVYVVEEVHNRVIALPDGDIEKMVELGQCRGPISIAAKGNTLAAACLLDHALRLWTLGGDGLAASDPRSIEHDGPIWSFDWIEPLDGGADQERIIVAAGVEDRPLDRSDGSFGYIDSFAYVYRDGPTPTRVAEQNLSELGVVTPKVVSAIRREGTTEIEIGGYGSATWTRLTMRDEALEPTTFTVPPGSTARSGSVVANPLLDAWVVLGSGPGASATVVPVPDAEDRRDLNERVGEALFFTTLMAPWNEADGRASRFTCETCHFEGYGDGRIHFTGRDDVHAVSKPLRGLFNNRPHFSRALDRSMTQMVHNEFRVANKASGKNPWFDIDTAEFPWLADLVSSAPEKKKLELPPTLSAFDLRKALMQFLMIFTHRPNPAVVGRDSYSDLEQQGEQLFLDHCEACHKAKLITDDLIQFVDPPFHPVVFAENGPVVWAKAEYEKTGVEPYVHPEGARVPSLRRAYKKRPYFTNGSAKEMSDVLERAGYVDGEFRHEGAEKTLGVKQREALAAFLALL